MKDRRSGYSTASATATEKTNGSTTGTVERRPQRLGVLAGAGVPAALYFSYVLHYSVNVPMIDDWSTVSLTARALRGHLGMGDLWNPWLNTTRLFVPRLFFVAFALIDHLNMRSIVFFSAAIFAASYVLWLSLLQSYLARSLTFVSSFVGGVVWFSVADFQNALWAFQLAWYLVIFCFMSMLYLLLVPRNHQTIAFGIGIAAAVAGSYSIIQGFVLWPVGLICILWSNPSSRRTCYKVVAWIAVATITTALYLPGFKSGIGLHPVQVVRYLLLLIGNVIPTFSSFPSGSLIVAHEVLGTALSVVALCIVFQSIRTRRSAEIPLPMLLIVFGLCFDLTIALGRAAEGPVSALYTDRYTMPNIILLLGIVCYCLARLPTLRKVHRAVDWRFRLRVGLFVGLGAFLLVETVMTTNLGITYGRKTHHVLVVDARVVVNLHRIPIVDQGCDLAYAVYPSMSPAALRYSLIPLIHTMSDEKLSVFQSQTWRLYRAEGPPTQEEISTTRSYYFGKAVIPGCK